MTTQITIQVPGGVETDLDMNRVIYRTASFSMQVDGVAGEFYLQIRDPQHDETFITGSIIRLYIDSIVRFGGFILTATKTWPLMEDTTTPTAAVRFWELKGTDWNILWTKQVVHDPAHTTMPYKMYAIGTYDDTILNDVLDNYTDIAEFCPTRSITRVGIVILDILANKQDGGGAPWNQGSYLNEPFAAAKAATGGIYYINAAGVITYCDVETVNATLGLSDTPDSDTGTVGYRITKIAGMGDQLCNDALVWGAALGSSQIVFRRVEDAASIAAHGRWQKALYSGGLYRSSSIDTVAGSMVYGTPSSLRGAKDDKIAMTCSVNGAPFSAGEKVRCQNHVWGFDMVLPVRKVTYLFPNPDFIVSELLLSYEVDVAWSIFEYAPIPTFRLPPFVVPPPPPIFPPVGGGGCICGITDTFTRTVSGGWGTSDAGFTWDDISGGGATASVDGTQGVLLNNGMGTGGQVRYLGLPTAVPVEAAFDFSLFNIPAGNATFRFSLYGATGELTFFPNDGIFEFSNVISSGTYVQSGTMSVKVRMEAYNSDSSVPTLFARVWPSGTTEPAGWGTTAFYNDFGPEVDAQFRLLQPTSVGADFTATIDNLDITGVNRCTAVQFDDFNRTVASGWGTATPSGLVWSQFDGGTVSVNGTDGLVAIDDNAAALQEMQTATVFGTMTEFTMTWRVKFDNVYAGSSAGSGNSLVEFQDSNNDCDIWIGVGGGVFSSSNLFFHSAGQFSSGAVDIGAYTLNAYYLFVLHVRYDPAGGGLLEAKFYLDGSTDPGWQYTVTAASGSTPFPGVQPYLAFRGAFASQFDPAYYINFATDSIDFDYAGKPCYPSGPTPISGDPNNVTSVDPSPSSVRVTNNINFVSGTPLVIYLPTAYLSGSVQMWFNGLLQTPGYNYTESDPVGDPGASPHGGNITLAALPYGATNPGGVGVVITITYIQNGPFAGTAVWP